MFSTAELENKGYIGFKTTDLLAKKRNKNKFGLEEKKPYICSMKNKCFYTKNRVLFTGYWAWLFYLWTALIFINQILQIVIYFLK
jgi:hypothetical protein